MTSEEPMTGWRQQHRTLADVAPSVLAALGIEGVANVRQLPAAGRVCLLLLDGLGWNLHRSHHDVAPFLNSLAIGSEPITVGFPATTATSIATLCSGQLAGMLGIVGYSFATREDQLLNALGWHRQGQGRPIDLGSRVVSEELQPLPTMLKRATGAGAYAVVPNDQRGSGLSRAALRGSLFRGVRALGDLAGHVLHTLSAHERVLCYAYHADLDVLGHVYGPASDSWRHQLCVR